MHRAMLHERLFKCLICMSLQADDHVLNEAFKDKPTMRAAMKNKTGRVGSLSTETF